jgi:uncharacterized protein YutE (UPF0331/DUF86 family)
MNGMITQQYDKVLARKAKVIERCVGRAREEHALAEGLFLSNYSRQDAAILNIQRACEAALDMAQRVVSTQKWGVAETSRDLFGVLQRNAVIDEKMTTTLSHMVGFRNLAVHDYEDLDMRIVESIIQNDASDLLAFSELVLKQFFEGKKP